jgi:hypothetical protein
MYEWDTAAGSCEQCSEPLDLQKSGNVYNGCADIILKEKLLLWFYYVKINNLDLPYSRASCVYVLQKDRFRRFLFFPHYVNPLKDMAHTEKCIGS